MADSKYTPNPLRPYYVPPTIGRETQPIPTVNATTPSKPAASTTFSFSDIDYSDYIPDASPSIAGTLKTALDKAVWKYTNVLMAQPFEVAKLILQVRVAQDEDGEVGMPQTPNSKHRNVYGEPDSDDEEPNYFTSSAPQIQSPIASEQATPRGRSGRPSPSSRQPSTILPASNSGHLPLKSPHSLLEAIAALSSNHGPFSIWKATNTTFIYTILHRTLETFLRSFLAAVLGVAETEVLLTTSSSLPDSSILNSPSPYATVLIATAAAALSSLVLAPIDTARTLQILLPSSSPNRNLLSTIRTLNPCWLIPSHLIPITFLTSTIPTLISTSTPLILKTHLRLDPAINPASWSVFTFLGSALDLSIKFPLETVLRRAQIASWTSPELSPACVKSRSKHRDIKSIVPVPTVYRGIIPTMWAIAREEGHSESQKDRTAALMGKAPRRKRKGQGVEGLYRGWRVGLWGLVGIWGTAFVGGLQGDVAAGGTPIGGKF